MQFIAIHLTSLKIHHLAIPYLNNVIPHISLKCFILSILSLNLYIAVVIIAVLGKGKAVPLQAWSGPEGSRMLRFPDFMTTAQDGGKVVSLTHRPGTHFC